MLDVEQWAQIRRMNVVDGISIKEIVRRTGLARNTVRAALRSDQPPSYERGPRPSKLDPFKGEIERLLQSDHRIPNTRIRELIAELGYGGGKTILDEHLREVRPRFTPKRTYQRTVYRPGEICQFDLWEPREEIPVGHGQTRRGWVVTSALGYSRAGAGALIFAKQAPDILWGMGRCLAKLDALPETVVWDREASGRPAQARRTWRSPSASERVWPASGCNSPPRRSGWRGWARQSARANSRPGCAASPSCRCSSSTRSAISPSIPRRPT